MDPNDPNKAALIAGIETDAAQEAEALVAAAEKQAAEKRRYAEKKAADLLDEARQRGAEQAAAVVRQVRAEVDLELKRRGLRLQGEVLSEILDRVRRCLSQRVAEPGYREILRAWLVEAATGLGVAEARVNASAAERSLIDEALLTEVSGAVARETGQAVHLCLDPAAPLEHPGVRATAADGRLAFDNQIRTRIRRRQREIHRLIHDALFSANSESTAS